MTFVIISYRNTSPNHFSGKKVISMLFKQQYNADVWFNINWRILSPEEEGALWETKFYQSSTLIQKKPSSRCLLLPP